MKERIHQLAEECAYHDFFDYVSFAEKIIKDCCEIAELKEQSYPAYDPDISVGHYIRNFFGLKDT